MKTLAAILIASREPLVLDEVELPILSFGQVLVEIKVTRICGSQIGEIDAVKGPDRFLPHLLGHEAGGIVMEIGPEVRHVKPGDRVVVHWRPGHGIEARPSIYRWRGQLVNAGWLTTFQQYTVVSENRVTIVPDDTDFELCALFADTLTTGFGVINKNAAVKIGESVVVIGAGGIGLGVVLGAHLAGANPIIAVDLYDHKLAVARRHGATHTINSNTGDFAMAAEKILGGKADVVIDGTGMPMVLEKAFNLTAAQGRCVIFGVMPVQHKLAINTLPLHFGKILTASHGGESKPAEDIPRYLRLMAAGRFDVRDFVSHRCPLSEINGMIRRMRQGEVIHAMVHF